MATMGSWYNVYSPKERDDKFKVLKRQLGTGAVPKAHGPCCVVIQTFLSSVTPRTIAIGSIVTSMSRINCWRPAEPRL